jgi:hypothetical protein
LQAFSAFVAELRSLGVLKLAFWAFHRFASGTVNEEKRLADPKYRKPGLLKACRAFPQEIRERVLRGPIMKNLRYGG